MLVANVIASPSLCVILSASEESLAQGKLHVVISEIASGRMPLAMAETLHV
jgi:hypothetical protein